MPHHLIADGRARAIAATWHDGLASGLYAFASTGAITDATRTEALAELAAVPADAADRAQLVDLERYLRAYPNRGPQPGWARLPDPDDGGGDAPAPAGFALTIRLGNDGMRAPVHVAAALRVIADHLEAPGDSDWLADDSGPIVDPNGNRVGGWGTTR